MANVATNTMTTEELLAPLASMEDLSVLMTPMSTPGPSPRTRARWSHRSSTGSQYEPYVASPLTTVGSAKKPEPQPQPPPRKLVNNLLKQSLENGSVNKYVTPYKHDPSVMNADLPPAPPILVNYRRSSSNFRPARTYPKIDEAEEFLLSKGNVEDQQPVTVELPSQAALELKESQVSNNNNMTRQVQFLTPRKHNHYYNNTDHYCQHLEADRVRLLPEPIDRYTYALSISHWLKPTTRNRATQNWAQNKNFDFSGST